jgi:uncharacterized protein with FMN-binding domain
VQKDETALYWIMLGLSLAFSVLAIVTLLPNPAASKPNVLGYRSVCSFAPAATALCCLLAGLTCTLRNRLVSRRSSSMRWRPLIVPAAVALPLLAAALVFGIRFGRAQAAFGEVIVRTGAQPPAVGALTEGTRRATVSEGEVSATVEVTVREGRIVSLRLAGGRNVDEALAAEIFERVRSAGSTDVDAVSGPTASSNVLLKAVADAASGM